MSSEAEARFIAQLRQGPSFLLLGQAYLGLQAIEDPLLSLILRKYGTPAGPASTYFDLLAGMISGSPEAALAWIEERCRLIAVPDWLDLVVSFAWNGVYSSAIDSIWQRALRTDWREVQPVLEEKYKPRDPRNKSVLHATVLFGCVNRTDE